MHILCPCCSGKTYEQCCKPLHNGAYPPNALALMRSRYAAYAYQLPDYIIKTTDRANSAFNPNRLSWTKEILYFCQHTQFEKLEIVDFTDGPKTASVSFIAYLKQNDTNLTLTEKSYFKKIKKQWLYHSGIPTLK